MEPNLAPGMVDFITQKAAEYGLAFVVLTASLFACYRAIKFLFLKYDEAMISKGDQALKIADTMADSTEAIRENTRKLDEVLTIMRERRGTGRG